MLPESFIGHLQPPFQPYRLHSNASLQIAVAYRIILVPFMASLGIRRAAFFCLMIPAAWVLPLYRTTARQAFFRGLCWNLWIQLTNKLEEYGLPSLYLHSLCRKTVPWSHATTGRLRNVDVLYVEEDGMELKDIISAVFNPGDWLELSTVGIAYAGLP